MRNLGLLAIVLMAILTLSAVACGDDDDGGATPTDGPTATIEGEQFVPPIVVIEGLSYEPSEFTIAAGEESTIQIQNVDARDHTFTLYTDEEFTEAQGNGITLSEGDTVSLIDTFDAGTYYFRCEFHPTQMQGSFTAE
ncbi:MAG: cupredoxin domain-containing protein [Dehalococcoidia bacterium]